MGLGVSGSIGVLPGGVSINMSCNNSSGLFGIYQLTRLHLVKHAACQKK